MIDNIFNPQEFIEKFFSTYKKVLGETSGYVDENSVEVIEEAINKYFDRSSKMMSYIHKNIENGMQNQKEGLKEMNRIYGKFVDFAYKIIFSYSDPYNRNKK